MQNAQQFFKRNKDSILLLLIILLALSVRLADFGNYPNGINQDEAMSAVDAKAIAEYGTDRYGNPHPVFFEGWKIGQQSAFLIYLNAFFLKYLPFNPFSTRLPILLLSCAGMAALYWIARQVVGKRCALIVLALSAINPWHIMQSRWALDCNTLSHMFIIAMALLIHAFQSKKSFWFFLSFLAFALCMYTYGVAYFTVGLFLATLLLYLLLCRHYPFSKLFSAGLLFLVCAAPLLLMMLINQFDLPSIQNQWFSIQYFPESIRVNDVLFFSSHIDSQLLNNIQSLFRVLTIPDGNEIIHALPWIGPLYLIYLPFFIVGLILVIQRLRTTSSNNPLGEAEPWAAILFQLTSALLTGLVISNVNVSRMNMVYYPILLCCAIAIDALFQKHHRLAWLTGGAYALYFVFFSFQYFVMERCAMNDQFFYGYRDAIQFADQFSTPICVGNSMFEHNYFMVSEILTHYHLEIDSQYYQGKTNQYTLPNGQILDMPYTERFQYIDYLQDQINAHPECVFVYYQDFEDYYKAQGLQIQRFPNYGVAFAPDLQTNQ